MVQADVAGGSPPRSNATGPELPVSKGPRLELHPNARAGQAEFRPDLTGGCGQPQANHSRPSSTGGGPEEGGGRLPGSACGNGPLLENLVESLLIEPYETVFAEPPRPLVWPIRNLDTGETRFLDDGFQALTQSFQQGLPILPSDLRRKARSPWEDWWAEKKVRDEALLVAAAAGDVGAVKEALQAPRDGCPPAGVNAFNQVGHTALHLAVKQRSEETLEVLLGAGADVNAQVKNAESHFNGFAPLHFAACSGYDDGLRRLLSAGACSLKASSAGMLPLHLAALSGHSSVVKTLLELGDQQQLLKRNKHGQTPLGAASTIEIQQILQEAGGSMPADSDMRTPLFGPNVLRRNTRSDYVQRMLLRVEQAKKQSRAAPTPAAPTPAPARSATTFPAKLLPKSSPPRAQPSSAAASRGTTPTSTPPMRRRTPSCASKSPGQTPGQTPQNSPRSSPRFGHHDTVRTPASRTTSRRSFATVTQGESSFVERVGPDSFEVQSLLGKGSFGEVYKVRHRGTSDVFAMKVLQKSRIRQKRLQRYAFSERNILSYVQHPYIVSLHYCFQTTSHLVMVLEFCPGGDLQRLLNREKRLRPDVAKLYAAEVVLSLQHLHERRVIYRDLKPENIVLDAEMHAKLTDFGLSKEGVDGHGTGTFCGSAAFLAPEILSRQPHNYTVDIYGIGAMTFHMLTGLPPYYHSNRDQLYANIRYAKLEFPDYMHSAARSFIEATMARLPSARIGAHRGTQALQEHEYFADIDFVSLYYREIPMPKVRSFETSMMMANSSSSNSRASAAAGGQRGLNPFEVQPGANAGAAGQNAGTEAFGGALRRFWGGGNNGDAAAGERRGAQFDGWDFSAIRSPSCSPACTPRPRSEGGVTRSSSNRFGGA